MNPFCWKKFDSGGNCTTGSRTVVESSNDSLRQVEEQVAVFYLSLQDRCTSCRTDPGSVSTRCRKYVLGRDRRRTSQFCGGGSRIWRACPRRRSGYRRSEEGRPTSSPSTLQGLFLVRPFSGPGHPPAIVWLKEEREECPSSSVERPERQCCVNEDDRRYVYSTGRPKTELHRGVPLYL
ncbi:hypothetical protein Y032_0825g2550 [Ancylostoma ceylanicum]|uniref:Uncharacterized protein n=1 Tax=Ancylostoma ceylanicum TaxID=53326 RepID=A0A016WBZ9_9BILA|nr:hypothetical protein Y032_0825g2550 [Ancylostoma ceylanicum]